jgi:hypothetical protein
MRTGLSERPHAKIEAARLDGKFMPSTAPAPRSIAFTAGVWLIAFLGVGCGPALELSPAEGSSFGNVVVEATGRDLASLSDPLSVTVGGIPAYDVTRDSKDQIHFTVQGAPNPGKAEVVVSGANAQLTSTFTYQPPVHPALARLVAMGASLTQGIQSAGISVHSQTHGVSAQFAAAASAYLSLPLVNDGIMPSLLPSDFNPTTCELPNNGCVQQLLTQRGLAIIPKLEDASGAIHIDRARVDPQLEVQNVAIGGFAIGDVANGGSGIFEVIMEQMLWDPFVNPALLFNPPTVTMLDRVVALNPTLIISTDLFINDLDGVDLTTNGIPDVSFLTPMDSFQASLAKILTALDGTGALYFLATSPDLTLMSGYQAKVAALEAAGYSSTEATSWLLAIRQRTMDMNAALVAAAATHPNLHVVDQAPFFANAFQNGIDVGSTHLSADPMGGLLSLDGMHPSDTGYALMAQQYIDAVNTALGANIPAIDVASVMVQDPYSVPTLRAEGLTCAGQ